jgi:hypothetical protein
MVGGLTGVGHVQPLVQHRERLRAATSLVDQIVGQAAEGVQRRGRRAWLAREHHRGEMEGPRSAAQGRAAGGQVSVTDVK